MHADYKQRHFPTKRSPINYDYIIREYECAIISVSLTLLGLTYVHT